MDPTTLPTRTLGSDGTSVGAIGLGCMGMSWAYNPEDRDDERSISVIRHALDIGVTMIDTADVYGPYANELLVGRALGGRRDDAVLATKCGLEVRSIDPLEFARNGRPEHVRSAIDASLTRLGTDHVDLYQLHRTDPAVPVAETWGAMADVVAAGKARAIGMSEATVEELTAAHAIHPVASLQSEFSLWERGPVESGVLAWCCDHGAAFIPFSPLGRGFLTGQVTRDTITEGDARASNPRFTEEAMEQNLSLVDRLPVPTARTDNTGRRSTQQTHHERGCVDTALGSTGGFDDNRRPRPTDGTCEMRRHARMPGVVAIRKSHTRVWAGAACLRGERRRIPSGPPGRPRSHDGGGSLGARCHHR